MQIAVVGSGYVGLVAAACFAEIGHDTICIDNDQAKIAALVRGETLIHEEFLPVLLERHAGKRLHFTTSLADSVRKSSVIFLAVGTPACAGGEADVSMLENVCHEIGKHIDGFKLVVVKSTVPVGTNKSIASVLRSGGAKPQSFHVASNPEFLREGSAVTDFLYPDRIVLGCNSEAGLKLLKQVYQPLLSGTYPQGRNAIPIPDNSRVMPELIQTNCASAEMIKHASNAFLAMKISFINAVAQVCEANEADIEQVVSGIGSDQRIGSKFLKPGIGFGGSCFPKDLAAFRAVARASGYDFRLLDEVVRINQEQRELFVRKVRQMLCPLKGKKLAVLGVAFKGGTDDVRESPAIAIVRSLLKEGCKVVAYDPAAAARAHSEFLQHGSVSFAESPYEAAADADALLILTDWEEFSSLDLELLRGKLKQQIVIDGRNLYPLEKMAKAGFSYVSIGRPEVLPDSQVAVPTREAA